MRIVTASCLALLTACGSTTAPNDSGDSGATDATMSMDSNTVDASAAVAQICSEYSDYFTRCNANACFANAYATVCPQILSHYRPEVLSFFQSCIGPSLPCAIDGGVPLMPNCSFLTLESQLTPTAVQQSTAMAICTSCPQIDPNATTTAGCASDLFMSPDGGFGPGFLLVLFNDETTQQVQTQCTGAMQPDAAGGCALGFDTCLFNVVFGNLESTFAACDDAGFPD